MLNFIISIEQEKVYIFLLAFTIDTPVLIVKSPMSKKEESNKEIKKFLGYEWSERNGNEGIQYLHLKKKSVKSEDEGDDDDTVLQIRGISGIQTPLFNPSNLNDLEKINTLIRKNF